MNLTRRIVLGQALLLLAWPAVAPAQLTFTTNNGALAVAGFIGNPKTLDVPAATNGYPVTTIAPGAFANCSSLTTVTFAGSITNLGNGTFINCNRLTGVYCYGDAPGLGGADVFFNALNAIIYYLPGTSGWGSRLSGQPAVLWNPGAQTGNVGFGVQSNQFGFNIIGNSNLVVVVEACTNLTAPVWSSLATNRLTNFTGGNGVSFFSDPQWTNYSDRFYRFSFP